MPRVLKAESKEGQNMAQRNEVSALEEVIPGRKVKPDLLYDSKVVEKLTNYLMHGGKKNRARKVVYKAFEIIDEKVEDPALDVFYESVNNCSPRLETRTRRVGGASYQVPYEVPKDRGITLALRWIVNASRRRSEPRMEERLANEILDAYHKEGEAYRKREMAHRAAEANRAFAHYRW